MWTLWHLPKLRNASAKPTIDNARDWSALSKSQPPLLRYSGASKIGCPTMHSRRRCASGGGQHATPVARLGGTRPYHRLAEVESAPAWIGDAIAGVCAPHHIPCVKNHGSLAQLDRRDASLAS